MNILPVSELKRRGAAALDEKIKNGPIHLIRSNHLAYVVVTQKDYEEHFSGKESKSPVLSLWDWIDQPSSESSERNEIDRRINQERNNWGKTGKKKSKVK